MFQVHVALGCIMDVRWSIALALLALRGDCGPQPESAPSPALGPRLEVFQADVGRLQPGDTVRAGDLIQLRYRAAGHRYGVIVSLDGAGVVTLHHPARPEAPSRVRPRMPVLLEHAFELDDAPGFERFFFVTAAAHEPRASAIVEAARRLGAIGFVAGRALPLPLPEEFTQTSFLLRKSP